MRLFHFFVLVVCCSTLEGSTPIHEEELLDLRVVSELENLNHTIAIRGGRELTIDLRQFIEGMSIDQKKEVAQLAVLYRANIKLLEELEAQNFSILEFFEGPVTDREKISSRVEKYQDRVLRRVEALIEQIGTIRNGSKAED